jgi:ribonuclease I
MLLKIAQIPATLNAAISKVVMKNQNSFGKASGCNVDCELGRLTEVKISKKSHISSRPVSQTTILSKKINVA